MAGRRAVTGVEGVRVERLFRREELRDLDWWAGFLLGFPVAWPGVPYYWLAFLSFALVLPRIRVRATLAFGVCLLMLTGMVSSFLSPYAPLIGVFRAFYTVGFYLFLFYGYGIQRPKVFFRGLLSAVTCLAIGVVGLFVVTGQFRHGVDLFIFSDLRDWGRPWLPDWPNYLAFLLGLAGILLTVRERHRAAATLCILAAIATTSRTGMLAAVVCGGIWAWRMMRSRAGRWTLATAAVLVVAGVGPKAYRLISAAAESPLVRQRLLRSDDRADLYRFSLGLVAKNPTLGVGAVLLDERIGAPVASFHNGYLEQLIRGGLVGFLVWLALMFPPRLWRASSRPVWIPIGYFAVCALFNTIYKDAHLFLIYSVLLAETAAPTGAIVDTPGTEPV